MGLFSIKYIHPKNTDIVVGSHTHMADTLDTQSQWNPHDSQSRQQPIFTEEAETTHHQIQIQAAEPSTLLCKRWGVVNTEEKLLHAHIINILSHVSYVSSLAIFVLTRSLYIYLSKYTVFPSSHKQASRFIILQVSTSAVYWLEMV